MKKTHLKQSEGTRHPSIFAYCGAIIDRDDALCWTTSPDNVTCGNCLKPGNLKRHELDKQRKR